MAIDEYLPAIFIILGIYLLIRFIRTPEVTAASPSNPDTIPGVTLATVETVHSAFPHIPIPNLIYSLSRTRSGQATSEEIIERGFLPAPPATFRIPSSLLSPTVNPPSAPSSPTTTTSGQNTKSAGTAGSKGTSLIERYGLKARVPSVKGKEVDPAEKLSVQGEGQGQQSLGQGKWEDSREGREKGLRERKERMILEARRRMMEKEAQAASA